MITTQVGSTEYELKDCSIKDTIGAGIWKECCGNCVKLQERDVVSMDGLILEVRTTLFTGYTGEWPQQGKITSVIIILNGRTGKFRMGCFHSMTE